MIQAEITGTRLTIAGTALPSKNITVDGVRMGRSDARGTFRITRDPFTAPADRIVDVNDGSRVPTVARLTGCTVSPSTNLAFLTPERLPDAVVGEPYLASIVVDDLPGPVHTFTVRVTGNLGASATGQYSVTVAAGRSLPHRSLDLPRCPVWTDDGQVWISLSSPGRLHTCYSGGVTEFRYLHVDLAVRRGPLRRRR